MSYSWTLWICTNEWLGNPLPTAELCESVSKQIIIIKKTAHHKNVVALLFW